MDGLDGLVGRILDGLFGRTLDGLRGLTGRREGQEIPPYTGLL